MISRNLCRAVAEVHTLNIVHGDLSSGNVLIDSASSDVKLIDFDMTSIEGTSKIAAGNEDFVSSEFWSSIMKRKKIESSAN